MSVPKGLYRTVWVCQTDTGSHIGGQPSLYRSSGWSDRSGLTGEIVSVSIVQTLRSPAQARSCVCRLTFPASY